jgi:hypothetical protein
MSKYEKGQTVWVKGTFDEDDGGKVWVRLAGRTAGVKFGHGEILGVKVNTRNVKPDVTFPWSPAKKAKKRSKK